MAAMREALPEVRLPPDRDWGSKPLPPADAKSPPAVMPQTMTPRAMAPPAALAHQRCLSAENLAPSSKPDEGPWMQLLNGDCSGSTTGFAAAAFLQQPDEKATAAGCAPAVSLLPCCGSETVMSGSMSETLASASAAASSARNAAVSWPAEADESAVQSPEALPSSTDSDGCVQEVQCNQLLRGRKVKLCWRCPE